MKLNIPVKSCSWCGENAYKPIQKDNLVYYDILYYTPDRAYVYCSGSCSLAHYQKDNNV